MGKKFILFFFFVVICPALVLGLGASPAKVSLKYTPNAVYEGGVCYSTGGIDFLQISVQGDFADNFVFLNLNENKEVDGSKSCLHYKFNMPSNVSIPGIHKMVILAREKPPETESMLQAVVQIGSVLDLVVPYPGKYLEITGFSATNVDAGDTVSFSIQFINKGNETVSKAFANVLIYDKDWNYVDRLKTREQDGITPDDMRSLFLDWNSGEFKQGNYNAVLQLDYDDGMKNNATTKFKLGGLDINMIDYTKEVIIGNIRPFYVVVDSIWSEKITGVKADVSMYNYSKSPEPILGFETLSRDISPWGTEILKGYIDVTNISLGTYDLKIILQFENLQKEYNKNISIIKEPVVKDKNAKKGFFLFSIFSGSLGAKIILILLLILLIVMIIIIVSLFIPRKKQTNK